MSTGPGVTDRLASLSAHDRQAFTFRFRLQLVEGIVLVFCFDRSEEIFSYQPLFMFGSEHYPYKQLPSTGGRLVDGIWTAKLNHASVHTKDS